MAACYICGTSSANYRREVYTGQSRRTNYGKRITFGHSTHYAPRSVCKACAKEIDWNSNFKVVFWQILAIGLLWYIYKS